MEKYFIHILESLHEIRKHMKQITHPPRDQRKVALPMHEYMTQTDLPIKMNTT